MNPLIFAGDPDYDDARRPWNLSVDQRPAAVALPTTAAEVAGVVRSAAANGLRVAPQGTGHNPGPLGPLDDAVLLRTSRMNGVTIDRDQQQARVEAGATWNDVIAPAAAQGLAALHGSSGGLNVVGYSLGGGIGWYSRMFGLQSNSITAVEVVGADGTTVRADADHDADLFWAIRGGGANFGVVTAIEFDLYPLPTSYAGLLAWDWSQADRVLTRYADWAGDATDAVTTAFRLLQLPPIPDIPEPFRGRQLAVIDGAVLADDADAEQVIAPLRELRPEIDTFARTPADQLTKLHMDPPAPTPSVSNTCIVDELPDAAVTALVDAAGPDSGTTLLIATELRQLGGALSRPQPNAGAVSTVPGRFVGYAVGVALSPELADSAVRDAGRFVEALAPFGDGRQYVNFAEHPVRGSTLFAADIWDRLRAIRGAVDPGELFLANHPIPA